MNTEAKFNSEMAAILRWALRADSKAAYDTLKGLWPLLAQKLEEKGVFVEEDT